MKLDGGQIAVRVTDEQMLRARALARLYGTTPAGALRRALAREWEASKEKAEKIVRALEEIER
jgi:hypothetical protein